MIDLHMHSTFSDGTDTPEELIGHAVGLGLNAVALTDHDNTAGLPRFLKAGEGKPLRTVPGVELSVVHRPGAMHILGYFIRHDDPALNDQLTRIRTARSERNREIFDNLNKLGLSMTWDEIAAFAGEDVVGRPHFAQAMVTRGYVSDTQEAFDRYLARGKPAYARRRVMTPEEAVSAIKSAGGVPVLAHPISLKLKFNELRDLIKQLRFQGLEGVEAYYSQHSNGLRDQILHIARDFDLVPTGGSDYHGAVKPDIRMGVGFGSLNVPDDIVDRLAARRNSA